MNLFYPNLTFEDELHRPAFQPTPATQRALNELAPVMGLLAHASDRVIVPAIPDPADRPHCLQQIDYCTSDGALRNSRAMQNHDTTSQKDSSRRDHADATPHQLIPWGWTSAARRLATEIGMSAERIPSSAAVAFVNSREFAAGFDPVHAAEDACSPFSQQQFGQLCETLSDWSTTVAQLAAAGYQRWVAKPQFSHAGRNRLLGTGVDVNSQQLGWLNRQLSQPGGIYVEPWVRIRDEAGLQYQIDAPSAGGRIHLIGVTKLLNDAAGRYAGSVIVQDDWLQTAWRPAVQHGYQVCEAAKSAGYFGPLGIDAFRFLTASGADALRPCNDINARFTMGRLAMELKRWLQPGETAVWCQLAGLTAAPNRDEIQKVPAKSAFSGVRLISTSPGRVADRPVRLRTLLVAGEALARVQEVAEMLRSGLPETADNNRTE